MNTLTQRIIIVAIGTITLALAPNAASALDRDVNDTSLDASVMTTLKQCQQISSSCATSTQDAAGVLVFPSVIKADLIVGGAGGRGALVENGKITGYYNIGAASAGLQAGVQEGSQVYVFRTPAALAELKKGSDWKAGASANVTVITADATARETSGKNVLVYVFDAEGLHAGVSLDVFNIWKKGTKRPSA